MVFGRKFGAPLAVVLVLSFFGVLSVCAANTGSSKQASPVLSEIGKSEAKLQEVRAKGNAEDLANALYDVAEVYFRSHNITAAEKYMTEALKVQDEVKSVGAAELKAKVHISLAVMHVSQKKYDSALLDYQNALTIAESAKLSDYVPSILNSKGTLLLKLEKLDEADSCFDKAILAAAVSRFKSSQIIALANKAVLFRIRGQKDQALELLKQAVLLHRGKKDRALANAYFNIAVIQSELDRSEDAVLSYKKALDALNVYSDPEMRQKTCYGLAVLLRDLNRKDESDKYFLEATNSRDAASSRR